MTDEKLAAEEERREKQHEHVKARVEGEVHEEIAAHAEVPPPKEEKKVGRVAGELRGKAVREVVQTEREIERARAVARVSQVVDYIFFIIYALLGVRLLLGLMAARESAGFVRFIHRLTEPLYAPFRGIVESPAFEGGYRLEMPLIVALVAYALLHAALNGLLRMLAHRKTRV